jgi:hypothetical protein
MDSKTLYKFLADVIVTVHFAYISYVLVGLLLIVIGGILHWNWVRNPWFRWTHLLCITIVAVEAIFGISCPLTDWENDLREWAGEPLSGSSFIGRLLNDILFVNVSPWILTCCYIGFALLVLCTFWLIPPRRRKRAAS